MVDVRVRQDDGFDTAWLDRKRRPVFQAKRLKPLEQSAVHENATFLVFDKVLRSGDRTDAAQKCEAQGHGLYS